MAKYELRKVYLGNNGRLYFVDEKEKSILIYNASISQILEKGITRDDGKTPEQVAEEFLTKTCEINL